MARRLTAIVVLLAAGGFGVDRLVSSSGRPARQAGRSTVVAAAVHATTAPRRAAPRPTQPFQSELRHAPPALRQLLLQRMLELARPVPRQAPRPVIPPLLRGSGTCFVAGGCSLKPCLYESYVETVAAPVAAAIVLLPNRPVPACVHPPPIRISAP